MAEKAMPMTKEGLERLEKELAHLRDVRRHEVAARIHEAKELASAQNNAVGTLPAIFVSYISLKT